MSRVSITDEIREELHRLQEVSGKGSMKILRGHKDIPSKLNSGTVASWLNGQVISARKDHLDYVLEKWRQVGRALSITDDMRQMFQLEFTRTGMTPSRFMRVFQDHPTEFSIKILESLRNGKRLNVEEAHWNFIMTSLKSLPTISSEDKKPYLGKAQLSSHSSRPSPRYIEECEAEEIKAHMERTGLLATDLIKRFAASKPPELSVLRIRNMLHKSQKRRTNPNYILWVLEKYRSLPDKPLK